MAVNVVTEIVIDKPVDVVASFAANPDNAPKWYKNIKSVEWKTSPPLTIAARLAFVAQFLGRTLRYTYEIVCYKPGKRLVMRTSEGPFPMETTYTWEALPGGRTKMTLRNQGEPKGFSKVVAPFMAAAMKRENKKDLERLKKILES